MFSCNDVQQYNWVAVNEEWDRFSLHASLIESHNCMYSPTYAYHISFHCGDHRNQVHHTAKQIKLYFNTTSCTITDSTIGRMKLAHVIPKAAPATDRS